MNELREVHRAGWRGRFLSWMTTTSPAVGKACLKIFGKKIKILIVDDHGSVLDRLKRRVGIFWPPDIPVKTIAAYCAWADEAIEAIREYQPDILLLNYAFVKDEKTGRDVARWIDQNYRTPIRVAAHSDRSEEDLRQLFTGTECVKCFIYEDRIKEFIEDCTR